MRPLKACPRRPLNLKSALPKPFKRPLNTVVLTLILAEFRERKDLTLLRRCVTNLVLVLSNGVSVVLIPRVVLTSKVLLWAYRAPCGLSRMTNRLGPAKPESRGPRSSNPLSIVGRGRVNRTDLSVD